MLYKHFTEKLLGLQGVNITNIESDGKNIVIYAEMERKEHTHKEPESARNALAEWVKNAEHCGILPFEKCAETIRNWYIGISNSFSTSITNGFTEGCNNKIKVLKRNAYGYKKFNRFINRILHIFSHKQVNNEQAAA